MDYLITGGAGFIGSHLADALLARGDTVLALDDLSTGAEANVRHLLDHPGFELREGSILDHDLVSKLATDVDVIVHLAAAVGVKLIVEHPLDSLLTNIRGTEIVLDAAAELGCKVLITSTSEIYGKNANGPLREDDDRILGSPFKARWSYSTSKAVDEILARGYWRDRGTPTVVVRLFNTVGPRQTGAYGMVVPRFVRQALLGEPVTVYGDGEQRRSLLPRPRRGGRAPRAGRPSRSRRRRVQRRSAERGVDQRARPADPGGDRLDLPDRAHPLRRRIRGGVRGHGAAGPGHGQARGADRVACDEVARGRDRGRDRSRAGRSGAVGTEEMSPGLRYLLAFVVPLVVVLVLTPVAGRLARRLGILDHPSEQKFHRDPTPYLGGVALAAGLVAVGFLTTGTSAQAFVILLGGLVLGVWGLLDDWVTVRPSVKLLVQASAGVALWFSDVRAGLFGNEVLDLALTVLWVVAVTNALNLLDNMDGLTAGVSAVAALSFAWIAAAQGEYLVASFALAVAGASAGVPVPQSSAGDDLPRGRGGVDARVPPRGSRSEARPGR